VALGVGDGRFVAVGAGVNVGGWDVLQSVAASIMTCVVSVGAELAVGDEMVGAGVDVVGIGDEQPTRIKKYGIRHDI
jgi:hypothetical protein